MRYVEHRRHSIRDGTGHLSQQGVTLARRVGETIGPFELVFTSPKPRAFETAIAMGFAVDEQLDAFGEWTDDLSDAVDHGGFGSVGALARGHGAAARIARGYRQALYEIARSLTKGKSALVISHSGVVEASAMACLPDLNGAELGCGVGHCEGVRLAFEGDAFVSAAILRL